MPDSLKPAFQTSPTTTALDTKLALVQGEIEAASKDRDNPFFDSRYSTLTSVWKACREALSKNGVSVTQWPIHVPGSTRLHMVTRVAHAGEWMVSEFSVPVAKQDPQGYGSALTYLRRFCLSAAVGVAPKEEGDEEGRDADDDGNAASNVKYVSPSKRKPIEGVESAQGNVPAVTPKISIRKPVALKPASLDAKPDAHQVLCDAAAIHSWASEQVSEYLEITFGVDRAGLLNPDQMGLFLSVLRSSKPTDALKEVRAYNNGIGPSMSS